MERTPEYALVDVRELSPSVRKLFIFSEKEKDILIDMFTELDHADTKYVNDRMSRKGIKSSFQTIKCELTELKREIVRKPINWALLKKEAVQVMAMGFKFNRDVVRESD